jgi:predicted DNA-binding transcriptional regulator YafY
VTRSERLLALLQSLRNRRTPITAASLAASFHVSERTIYRDLASLAAQGAGIEGAPGLGYVLRDDCFLPPLMLDAGEADAIMLGLRFVMQRGDPALSASAGSAAAKILAVLPASVEQQAKLNGLVAAPARGSKAFAAIVRHAIRAERKLGMTYNDAQGAASVRSVSPVALGFFDGFEVLAAWCDLRSDFRHFRLDRIATLEQLHERLEKPHRALLALWQARNSEVVL